MNLSEKELGQEQEANVFALFLLMPNPIFGQCLSMMPSINLFEDEDPGIEKLAKSFNVTKNMVIARLHLELQLRSNPRTYFY